VTKLFPLERGRQRKVPPIRNRYFTATVIRLASKRLQIDTDLLLITASTADRLSEGPNIDNLERPWNRKNSWLLVNFSRSQAQTLISRANCARIPLRVDAVARLVSNSSDFLFCPPEDCFIFCAKFWEISNANDDNNDDDDDGAGDDAGLRLLVEDRMNSLISHIDSVMRQSSFQPFFYTSGFNTRVLSGEEEGVFTWIAVNYLLGVFSNDRRMQSSVFFLINPVRVHSFILFASHTTA